MLSLPPLPRGAFAVTPQPQPVSQADTTGGLAPSRRSERALCPIAFEKGEWAPRIRMLKSRHRIGERRSPQGDSTLNEKVDSNGRSSY